MQARHYMVAVHGIGEQKLNQTTTPVVHRFAEVRHGKKGGHFRHLLPSYLSAQSVRQGGKGHGWSEFQGIPLCPKNPPKNWYGQRQTFNGTPAADSVGQNFRFVDLHWQHILERHQERYAAPAEQWAPALLARLKSPITPAYWLPPWASPLLRAVINIALPTKNMLGLRKAELSEKIFDGFLGDVHLYGDYSRTRGKAVRHFHVILDEIMLRDFIDWCHRNKERKDEGGYKPPRFTIIAHSLGSIMSFDALVYAHAKQEVREAQRAAWHSCPSIPFLGYTYQTEAETRSWNYIKSQLKELRDKNGNEWSKYKDCFPQSLDDILKHAAAPAIPLLTWRDQIENFITLGSPIDKYHVLWWQKYLHMGLKKTGDSKNKFKEPKSWNNGVDKWLDSVPERKIPHYNFCDEQDPVGHHLNVARSTVNYKKIFDPGQNAERDIVFRRYAIPGLAHTMYWEDSELFKEIVEKIIDKGNNADIPDRPKAFKQALGWAYFRVPLFAALVTGLLIVYAILGSIPIYRIAAGFGAILLWTRPNLLQAYKDESDPETFVSPTKKARLKSLWLLGKIRLRRGILAHLVAGMVEWRRILLKMQEESLTLPTYGKREFHFWRRFLLRFAAALGVALLSCACGYGLSKMADIFDWCHTVTTSGIILSVSYMGTMLYVAYQFLMAKHVRK